MLYAVAALIVDCTLDAKHLALYSTKLYALRCAMRAMLCLGSNMAVQHKVLET